MKFGRDPGQGSATIGVHVQCPLRRKIETRLSLGNHHCGLICGPGRRAAAHLLDACWCREAGLQWGSSVPEELVRDGIFPKSSLWTKCMGNPDCWKRCDRRIDAPHLCGFVPSPAPRTPQHLAAGLISATIDLQRCRSYHRETSRTPPEKAMVKRMICE